MTSSVISRPNGKDWQGRFPQNDIISLLQVNRRFNLAESTSHDLNLQDVFDLVDFDAIRNINLGYGSDQGDAELRREISVLCNTSPDHIITTSGAALAIYLLAVELCRPQDEVIVYTPCFPTTCNAFKGANIQPLEIALKFEDGYRVDLTRFEEVVSPNTKLVCLASPQNPSGVKTDLETIKSMLGILRKYAPQAYLFIDEVYLQATYDAQQETKSMAGLDPRIITCGSVSKSFGAPGLRVGWMSVANESLRNRLITAKMNIVLSGSPLNETLAAHLLYRREDILKPRRDLLSAGLRIVQTWQNHESAKLDWVKPSAGALCCFRLKPNAFSPLCIENFWHSLESFELQLASGEWFGEKNNVFRLGFGYQSLPELQIALKTVSEVMDFVKDT